MLRSLKEVQADDSVVGFYQATTLGAFLNQTLVDTQAIHQDKLRHGGVVMVHGKQRTYCTCMYIHVLFEQRPVIHSTRKCIISCVPPDGSLLDCLQADEL